MSHVARIVPSVGAALGESVVRSPVLRNLRAGAQPQCSRDFPDGMSGGGGIRTLEPLARPTVFETAPCRPGYGLVEPNYHRPGGLWGSVWASQTRPLLAPR